MDIREIRAKYPQYNDLSDEQLAKGLHAKYYSDMPFEEFSGKIGFSAAPALRLSEEQKEQIAANNRTYEEKQENNLLGRVLNNPIVRAQAAASQGIANASFNPFGYVARALGLDTKPLETETATERALEKAGEYGFDAAALAAGGSGLKGAGLLGKGGGKTSKIARALLAPEVGEAVAGAAAGGALEGLTNPESTSGKIAANLAGGIAGGGIYGLIKAPTTKAMRSGLENVVNDTEALKIVRRGAKADDDIAREVRAQATDVAGNINAKTADKVRQYLDSSINTEAGLERAKNIYQNFINQNVNRATDFSKKPRGFNQWQQEQYDKFVKEGLKKADPKAEFGGLSHVNETKKLVNDAIEASYITRGLKEIPTEDTALLAEVKAKINKQLQNSGVKPLDEMYQQAKRMDELYELGKKYKPSNIKFDDLNFNPPETNDLQEGLRYLDRKKAFKKGLGENILYNATPKENLSSKAQNYQNILKDLLTDDGYKDIARTLSDNDIAFSRLGRVVNTAENKLTVPEGSRIFGREQLESKGSMLGSAIDTALGKLNRDFYAQNANKLLQGNGEMVDVLTDPVYLQRALNTLKGGAGGGIREGELLYLLNLLNGEGKNNEIY